MTSFSESVSLPPSIVSLHRVSPIRLQLGSASVISVQVLGDPLPWVSWFVGKNRIQTTNPNFRAEVVGDGRRHNLRVTKVTRELDEGVAIEARNDAGTDYRKLAIAISQDGQVEDFTRQTSSTLASSNGAIERLSSSGGATPPVTGRSNYSFTDDVFDELISPGIPPLLLVQRKETAFPDDASGEILCPMTDEPSRDPAAIKAAQEKKNLRTKATDVKSGRHDNETVSNVIEGVNARTVAEEIWKMDGVALDTVCRDLLKDAMPSENDMDDLVSQNENWKPNRRSKVAGKSEKEKLGRNSKSILQPPTAIATTVATAETNAKKTSRLAKLKDKIKRIKSGKKQSNADKDHNSSIGLHPTATVEALVSKTQDETPNSGGKTSINKRTTLRKNSISAENGKMVEVIVPYSAESSNSEIFPAISRISTDKRVGPGSHENSKKSTSRNGLVERQNELAGAGDLSPAGYNGLEKPIKYKTSRGKECDFDDRSNGNTITDSKGEDESIDLANKRAPQGSAESRQIESQGRDCPRILLLLKDPNAPQFSDSNEIFDENRITLACSSPPADEVERCRQRNLSSLSQDKSSSDHFHQRRSDSDGRTGRMGYRSSDDWDTDSCGVASPTSPTEQCRMKVIDVRSSKAEPAETRIQGSVVERRTRAQPTPRSRSCQRPSTTERRSWIETARSVEIQVPRRSRSTSRTRWRSLNKEWDLVTVTTTTEEIRTLPNPTAAHTKAAVAKANKAMIVSAEDEIKSRSTTPTVTKTVKSTTKSEVQDTVSGPAKKSPKIEAKQTNMDSNLQHSTNHSQKERTIYRATQHSSVDNNLTDAEKSVLKKEKVHSSSSDSPPKTTTPRRSRKDKSLQGSPKPSHHKGTNKNLLDAGHRQSQDSFSSDFIDTSEENRQPDAIAYEEKVSAEISTTKRRQFGSVKVEDASELSEASNDLELRNGTERVEFKADGNEKIPEMVELRFKVIDVNPEIKMVEVNDDVGEVVYDVNCETNEVNQKTDPVEVNHAVNYDKETAEKNRKLDEGSRGRHLVQVSHEVNQNSDGVQPDENKPYEVSHAIDYSVDKVELNAPEVTHAKKMTEFSNVEVTELNEAVNKLSAEMAELNTHKTQLSSKSVDPTSNTMTAEELPNTLHRSLLVTNQSHSLVSTEEDVGFQGGRDTEAASLDSEVLKQNDAEEAQFSSERTELNDETAQLNRAMTQLSAEMVELNADNPERFVNVPSSSLETYEVNIALPKGSGNTVVVEGSSSEVPVGRTTPSAIVTAEHSFLVSPHEKTTLQKGHTSSLHVFGFREQPNTAADLRKDQQREEVKRESSSAKRLGDSESQESTQADGAESTDGSVFERVESDSHTGQFEISTDSEDVFDRLTPVETVAPKVMSEFTHSVRNTDDADMADSLTSDVTKGQHSEDAMTTFESMTTAVMSGVSEDDDDADTMESLTPDVMSDVNAAVTDAAVRNTCSQDTRVSKTTVADFSAGTIQLSIKPGDVFKSGQKTTEDGNEMNRRPDSGLSQETTSFEETTDEDSYAIADDNWKISSDTCYSKVDFRCVEEADTCEEDETSMTAENTLEYKQVDALESMGRKAPENGENSRGSFQDEVSSTEDVLSSTVTDSRDALQEPTVSQITRDAEASLVESDSKRELPWLTSDGRTKELGTDKHSEFPGAADDDQVDVHDYLTYIRSVFGARSLSSSAEERDADTKVDAALPDSVDLLEPGVHRHTTKRVTVKLARNTAIDTPDLTNNEMSPTVAVKTEDKVGESKSMAQELHVTDTAEAQLALPSDSSSPSFKVPEDAPLVRAERKISVSSLVLRRPDVQHVTIEERIVGPSGAYPAENVGHGVAVESDSKAHRSELQTEIILTKPLMRSITLPNPVISHSQGNRRALPMDHVAVEADSKAYRNELQTEIITPKPLTRSMTLPNPIISPSQSDKKVRTTNRVTSLVEIVINSLGVKNSKTSDTQLNSAAERSDRTSLSEVSLQIEKNYALIGPHPARQERTFLSVIPFQTEKKFALEGHLARPSRKSLSEIKLQPEKKFVTEGGLRLERPNSPSLDKNVVLEGSHLASPNPTSLSEMTVQIGKNLSIDGGPNLEKSYSPSLSEIQFRMDKDFILQGPHSGRPNPTALSEIKFQTERNFAIDGGLNLEKPNPPSLSEIQFRIDKNVFLEGLHLARPNPTSLSEMTVQREKNFAIDGGLNLEKPNSPSLSEVQFRTDKSFVLQGPHLGRPNFTALSEIKVQTEKNFALEGLHLAHSYRSSFSPIKLQTQRRPTRKSEPEIKFKTEKNYALESHHPARPNRTSFSEINFQTEKIFPLEGPHLASQIATAKHSANQTFRTILTIIGQSNRDAASIDTVQEAGIGTSRNPELNNNRPNEVTTLTVPNFITVLLNENDEVDLTKSSIASHEIDTNLTDQKLPDSYSNEVGETPHSEEENKVHLRSESLRWNPSSGDTVDNKDTNSHLESLDESSSEIREVMFEDKDMVADESVADIEEGYDVTGLQLTQVNLSTERSLTPKDAAKFTENSALACTVNVKDLEVEEDEFQPDVEFAELHYEYENKEIMSEMARQAETHFIQSTVVASVESESEQDSANEISWKEEPVDILKLEGEEIESNDVDIIDVLCGKGHEENDELVNELTVEDGSLFAQTVVVDSVEIEEEPLSGYEGKTAWTEGDSEYILREKEVEMSKRLNLIEAHDDNKLEEHNKTMDEVMLGDQRDSFTTVETECESETEKADMTSWKQEETIDTQTNEDTSRVQVVNPEAVIADLNDSSAHADVIENGKTQEDTGNYYEKAFSLEIDENTDMVSLKEEETVDVLSDKEEEALYKKEMEEHLDRRRGELIFENESRYDQEIVVTDVETELSVEIGKADETAWKEEEPVNVADDEGLGKSRVVIAAEELYDNEMINDPLNGDGSNFDLAMAVTSVDAENVTETENSDNTSWIEKEALAMLADEEKEMNTYTEITDADDDQESTEIHETLCEFIAEYVGKASREDEPESGDVEKSGSEETNSWKKEEDSDLGLPTDEENSNKYVIERHNDNKLIEELMVADEGHLDQTVVLTSIENESKRENNSEISWEEEEMVDLLICYEGNANDEETIEKHPEIEDRSVLENKSHFGQRIVITSVETESESESESAEEIAWKEDVAVDNHLESRSDDYLESMSQSLSEKRWQEIELLRKASDVQKDEDMEKSRCDNDEDARYDNEITDESVTEDGGHFDETEIVTGVETEEETLNGNAGKTTWTEEESEYILRDEDEEERKRYLNLTDAHYDNEYEERIETIDEVMLDDESQLNQLTVFTGDESKSSEWVDVTTWKVEEKTEEATSGQQYPNPESVAAEFDDSIANADATENGRAQEEDKVVDYEAAYDLESADNDELRIEHESEPDNLETSVRPKEKSYSEQSPSDYQTSHGTESIDEYESRSEDVRERIWKLLESQRKTREVSSIADSQRHEHSESRSDDYLESTSQSLSEKRWQEIERLRKATDEALAKDQLSVKGLDYETWHRGFSIRKYQTMNSTEKPRDSDVNDETTSRTFGDEEFKKSTELADENEYESFSTGVHEEGWRTVTLTTEQFIANTGSGINPAGHTDRDKSPSDSDYMVTYEYGEMYSVFQHVPFSIETLRESVMENFNSNPTMRRLLTRYPSLRPGTWKWSSTLRPSQRPWESTAAEDTRIREVQHLETVSVADQFTPQLMTEKFDTV